jgi:Na+/proline symporter
MRRNGFIAGVIATLLAVLVVFGAYRFVVNRSEYLGGVGRIPGGDFNSLITLPDGVDLTFPELIGKMIGPQIEGNRVLVIGDSIMASTSSRYGNEMCNTLTKLG